MVKNFRPEPIMTNAIDVETEYCLRVVEVVIKNGKYCNVVAYMEGSEPAMYVELSGISQGPIGASGSIVEATLPGEQRIVISTDHETYITLESDSPFTPKFSKGGSPIKHNDQQLMELEEYLILKVETNGPANNTLRIINNNLRQRPSAAAVLTHPGGPNSRSIIRLSERPMPSPVS